MEIGHVPSFLRELAALWCLSSPVRQRDWIDDSSEDPSIGIYFYNGGKICFQNSMMLCQLWISIVFEDITTYWWGQWGRHIQRFLMDDSDALANL